MKTTEEVVTPEIELLSELNRVIVSNVHKENGDQRGKPNYELENKLFVKALERMLGRKATDAEIAQINKATGG